MRALAAAALVMLVACEQPAADTAAAPADTTDYMAVEVAAAQSYATAYNAKDIPALMALYADDAVEFRPDSTTVTGKAAIQAEQEAFFAGPVSSKVTITPKEAAGSGDWYWASGDVLVELTGIPGTPGPVQSAGKYISIVKRGADGTWKMHRLIWNDNTAAM